MLSAGKHTVIPNSMLVAMQSKRRIFLDAVKNETVNIDSMPISAEAKKAIRAAR